MLTAADKLLYLTILDKLASNRRTDTIAWGESQVKLILSPLCKCSVLYALWPIQPWYSVSMCIVRNFCICCCNKPGIQGFFCICFTVHSKFFRVVLLCKCWINTVTRLCICLSAVFTAKQTSWFAFEHFLLLCAFKYMCVPCFCVCLVSPYCKLQGTLKMKQTTSQWLHYLQILLRL